MSTDKVVYKLSELITLFGGELIGDDVTIASVASLESAGIGQLSFYTGSKFSSEVENCHASAVVLKKHEPKYKCSQVLVKNPQLFITRVLALIYPARRSKQSLHPMASIAQDACVDKTAEIGAFVVIESGARIGANTIIESGSTIGENVLIGDHCRIHARVVIYADCEIGNFTEIHSGVVIGSDGFGNAWTGQNWEKIPQIGRVIVGSHVEIGANTTIDRGALDNTFIADGVRLDNLIQVAHNVKIGKHTAIAACSGIAGSTTVGSQCLIGGGVLIAGHIEIADGITLLSGGGTPASLTEPGVYASGVPTMPYALWARNSLQYKRLDEMAKRIRKIEKICLANDAKQLGEENGTD
ncbi:UDP-3-O-(3-hydroxymyristoyl)glucosamine N-acyltransferase [Deefgea rivuli]|uniref:UDP-3-O-(3-hydroxymyristoyl)glucosamine N-acyltransferase n=1 Tax=Deefgea rivuli TaxID=400948 RepID=UPI0006858642|nr:UDP-3-O-(3-hydroxymyristoyl)glucosamine N-acyltransferase [Deefgea rivuli]